jgi:GT2 family glycosyltransferase
MEASPQVVILVLNWNNYPDTRRCLDSIRDLDCDQCQLVVVDNGSDDGSNRLIREKYPTVKLLETGKNLGFAGGNNIGLAYAVNNDIPYVLLLNNDTEVIGRDFLRLLLKEMQADERLAVVGPMVYRPDGKPQQTILPYPTFKKTLLNTMGLFKPDLSQKQTADSVSGCCVLIKTRVIQQIGLMDENIFLYVEETEWFHRMRQAGWKVLYLPVKSVMHKGASSSKRFESEKIYIDRRANVIYTLVKGGHRLEACLVGTFMIKLLLIRILSSRMNKHQADFSPAMVKKMFSAFQSMWAKAAKLRSSP